MYAYIGWLLKKKKKSAVDAILLFLPLSSSVSHFNDATLRSRVTNTKYIIIFYECARPRAQVMSGKNFQIAVCFLFFFFYRHPSAAIQTRKQNDNNGEKIKGKSTKQPCYIMFHIRFLYAFRTCKSAGFFRLRKPLKTKRVNGDDVRWHPNSGVTSLWTAH